MAWRWFKKKPEKCSKEDVTFFLLLCTGRMPADDAEISLRTGSGPFALCKTLLSSDSFRRDIVEPLLLERFPALTAFSDGEQAILKSGLRLHFGLSADQSDLTTWVSCLQVAVGSERFLRAVEASSLTVSGRWLREALHGVSHEPSQALAGAVETISSGQVTGYALNRTDIDKRLSVEIFVNGQLMGIARTEAQRRDIQETFGGNGQFGFRLDFSLPEHLARQDNLVIHAFDLDSKIAICNGQTLHNISARHEHYLSRLLGELAALRTNGAASHSDILECLNRIESYLPKIGQFAALPLEDYGLHARLFAPASVPQSEQPMPSTVVTDPARAGEAPVSDILVFAGPDECLADHAEDQIAAAARANPEAVVFFADHDVRNPCGDATKPTFKTAFDYDLLLACPGYACAYAIRREALESLGGFQQDVGPAGHLDLWLRAYEKYGPEGFCHVGQVLWHHAPEWTAPTPIEARKALDQHFARQTMAATFRPHQDRLGGDASGLMQVDWPRVDPAPKLCIVIPTRDAFALTRNCVESLLATLAFPDLTEIIVVDNDSTDTDLLQWLGQAETEGKLRVIRSDMPFNWSALNNLAVGKTDAEYLLFLNNDTAATEPGWDAVLRGQLARADVGAVGARLFFEDGTIQFGGYVLEPDQIAVKTAYGESPVGGGYLNLSQLTHECSALIGAFLACRRETFDRLGGFDEDLGVAFNDIDFTIRIKSLGLRNLYCPEISFYHYESKTRGYDAMDPDKKRREQNERGLLVAKHRAQLAEDRHYPKAFIACEPTYTLLAPPKE